MNNFIVRTITAVFFVAAIVCCFLRAEAMVLLFALVTGLTIWEFTSLVNDRENITVNRFICTVAGVYFFFAMAGYNAGITPAGVFIPYLISIIYLMVAELYLKQEDPVNDWAYNESALYRPTLLAAERAGLPFGGQRHRLQLSGATLRFRVPLDQRHGCLYLWFTLRQA